MPHESQLVNKNRFDKFDIIMNEYPSSRETWTEDENLEEIRILQIVIYRN